MKYWLRFKEFEIIKATITILVFASILTCESATRQEQQSANTFTVTEPSVINRFSVEERSFTYRVIGSVPDFDPAGLFAIKVDVAGIGETTLYFDQSMVENNESILVYPQNVAPERIQTSGFDEFLESIGGSEIFTKTGGDNKPPIQTKSMGFGDRLRARMSKASPQSVDSLRLPAVHRYE